MYVNCAFYDTSMRFGTSTQLDTMRDGPQSGNAPRAIFILGYFAPVLYGVPLDNLSTVCVRTLKISTFRQFDMLNMMIDGPQSGNVPKSYFWTGVLGSSPLWGFLQ